MKTFLLFVLLCILMNNSQAQSYLGFDAKGVEWAQLAESKLANKLNAAMKILSTDILGNVQKVKNTMGELKNLYEEYFNIYADVRSSIKSYETIIDIKNVCQDLNAQGWVKMYADFTRHLTPDEKKAYQSLLLNGCIKFPAKKIRELAFVLDKNKIKMSEEKRKTDIDAIYSSLNSQLNKLQSVVLLYQKVAEVNKSHKIKS